MNLNLTHSAKSLLFLFVLLFCFSCVRTVYPPIRNVASKLVAEGWITTDPPPYTINLSYSGKFTNAYLVPQQLFISDARVIIADDTGDSTLCQWINNGTYLSSDPNFIGKVGSTYTLKIYLSNGKTYSSLPEKIAPAPPIDSVLVKYDSSYISGVRPNQLIISVRARDAAGTQNFYRWTSSGYIPRKSVGDTCDNFQPPCSEPFYCQCDALCEQFVQDNDVNILSDQFIDGKEMNQPVFYSAIYWYGKHYIEVKQYSITRTAYQFWKQFLDQTNRTGSTLDPLPGSLTGNIYNVADSNDIALGLFSASDVYTKRIVIVLFNLQQYWLESIAGDFIKPGFCEAAYPNSLPDTSSGPQGWGDAQEIDIR
jgi:hypothetical protein